MEEAGETETDLEIGGEDLEVGLVVIEEEEDHTPEVGLKATKGLEEEIHAVDQKVKDTDPPQEIEIDQDPNRVPDQDPGIERYTVLEKTMYINNTSIITSSTPCQQHQNTQILLLVEIFKFCDS